MNNRITLKIQRVALRIGIALTLIASAVAFVLVKSVISTLLGAIVSAFLWKLGFIVTDIIIDGNNINLVLFNNKKIKLTMGEIVKIDNYKDYTFTVKTTDGKIFVGTDSVTTKLLVWINGEPHARICVNDFPAAEYILH